MIIYPAPDGQMVLYPAPDGQMVLYPAPDVPKVFESPADYHVLLAHTWLMRAAKQPNRPIVKIPMPPRRGITIDNNIVVPFRNNVAPFREPFNLLMPPRRTGLRTPPGSLQGDGQDP